MVTKFECLLDLYKQQNGMEHFKGCNEYNGGWKGCYYW